MSDDPSATRDALRGASDGLLIAIREVDARERMKRGVRPGDPDFAPLAREVRIAAEAVLTLARQEEARAEETMGSTGPGWAAHDQRVDTAAGSSRHPGRMASRRTSPGGRRAGLIRGSGTDGAV